MLGLAACASTPPASAPTPVAAAPALSTPEGKQALVAKRARERWDLLIKDDLDGAYQYMSAGSRDTTTLDRYKANTRRGSFREATIGAVTCDGDACTVKLTLVYDHPKMRGITTPLVESWIVVGGQAWYVYGR